MIRVKCLAQQRSGHFGYCNDVGTQKVTNSSAVEQELGLHVSQ